jgi:hypothetical protein
MERLENDGPRRVGRLHRREIRRRRLRRAASRHGVNADDGIARRHFLIREIDPAIAMEHRLVFVRRTHEGDVLLPGDGLARVPREDQPIVELVRVARAGHPLLEKGGNERNRVDDVGADLLQVDEAAKAQIVVAAAERDEPGRQHLQRVQALPENGNENLARRTVISCS